jgi:hypothetical protein
MITRLLHALALVCLLAGTAFAQEPPSKDKDAEGYEKVDSDMMQKGESIPANRLVGAAYGFIFAAIVVYVVSVVSRGRRVEDEIDALMRKLDAKGK